MDVNKSDLDLSGKLIIKVQLGDDIRRIPIHNEAITYDELVLMMQRVFRGKLTPNDDITLKYKDDDSDLITIFDSSDLSFAIQCSRILKLQILLASNTKTDSNTALSTKDLTKLKSQLRSIRDQVNTILDTLDGGSAPTDAIKEEVVPQDVTKSAKVNPSEFDPLQEEKNVSKNGTHEVVKSEGDKQQQQQQQQPQQQQQQQMESSVNANSRPQSANNHGTHASDYFNRTPTTTPSTAGYPMQYGSLYPSQFSYPPSYIMDSSQIPSSTAAHPYPTQQQAQQHYTQSLYQPGAQGNPYSKNYTQPSPQHGYLPPRQ